MSSQPPGSVRPQRVVFVVAIDATSEADHVLTTAAGLASPVNGAELHLVHVVDDPAQHAPEYAASAFPTSTEVLEQARILMEAAQVRTRERFAGPIVAHLAVGKAWREILQLAVNLQADVIVAGSRGRKGFDRLVHGSVADHLLKRAQCAVIVARQKDYHGSAIPEIEPPCPDCLVVQRETAGEKLWCERHTKPHPRTRLHYETPQPFALGTMFFRDR
jgi:nucleotide-binding universal stress UspA family protein